MTEGCVHIHVKNGKISNIFSHISEIPNNGVIHLKPEMDLTLKEFKESHPFDENELYVEFEGRIYDLGPNSIE